MCKKEISQGAKLCYARLSQYSGKNGQCNPSLEKLSESLGVSDRQTRTYIRELESQDLIESVRTGLGRSNHYKFPEHDWMFETTSDPDQKDTSDPDQKDTSGPIEKRINRRENTPHSPSRGILIPKRFRKNKKPAFTLSEQILNNQIKKQK
jgi:DNA-binding transcriptional MocR family regulator